MVVVLEQFAYIKICGLSIPSGQKGNGRNGPEWTFVGKKPRAFLHYVTLCHIMSRKRRNIKGFDR